ncbi:hypothetical protein ACFOU2_09610 [Bacillus songklensis]|uniref:Uncharacterized protein n=1 Tax=Bacillus songklensis TaxID=1069116 RepID=A0ABV8B3D1_9BACI
MTTYQAGNTVRLAAEFKDWDGENVDPETIKLIIYDYRYNKLDEREIQTENRTSIGAYYYDYIFNEGEFIYEWLATINRTPSLIRKRISVKTI